MNTELSVARHPATWAWRASLLVVAAAYVAGPLAAVAMASTVSWEVKAGLLVLAAAAAVAPHAAPIVLLVTVPFLPILPAMAAGIPGAIVHLVLLTQAVPVLVRMVLSPGRLGPSMFLTAWAVFLLVCAVSVGVELTPDRLRGAPLGDVWRDLSSQVPSYVFATHLAREASAVPLLISLADGLLCALIVHATVTRATRPRVLAAAAAGAVATAIFGFVQARTGVGLQTAWQIYDPGIVRINATFVDPNSLAAYYALLGPVLLALALGSQGIRRGLWAAAFAAVCAAMVMTAGRTGLFSLTLACLLLFWLGLRRRLDEVDPLPTIRRHGRTVARRACLTVVGALCLVVLVGTALNISHAQQTSYLHTWLYTFNLRQPVDSVAKGRMAVWQTMAAMVRDSPVVGVGLGMGVHEFERYRRQLGVETLPPDARLSAHNTFLLVAGDLGALGLTAWLLVMLTVVHGIRAPGNLPPRNPTAWPVLGLAAGLAGLALTMLTGDRILLREDIVLGTTCAALACVGAGRLPVRLRTALYVMAVVALVSWPARVLTRPVDADVLPQPQGLHGAPMGPDGPGLNWSTGYVAIYLPNDTRSVTLPLRNLSPHPQRLRVYLDGRPADERVLPHGPWLELTYTIPARSRHGRWRRLTFEVEPTWQPPGDPRTLGVVVGDWRVERRASQAP